MALSKGCTVALIVVAAIILLLVIGIFLLGPKLLEKGIEVLIDKTEAEIIANIPDGYTPEMVHQIMEDLKVGVKNDQLSSAQIQELANTFQAAMADKELDQEEGRRLLVLIQEALGQEPPAVEEDSGEEIPDSLQMAPDSV
jgi:hypothetical protein